MDSFKKDEMEIDDEMMGEESIFAKLAIRPLVAANCTDFVLAHSNVVLRPLRRVSEIFMMSHFPDVMNTLGLNKLLRVQSHTWRHLVIGRDHGAMVVAAPLSGRTFSYILPVCDVVGRTIKGAKNVDMLFGPLALILVPDQERVRHVSSLCFAFLRNVSVCRSKTYTPILTVPSSWKPEFFHRMLSGVGCLVATPPQLVWAMNSIQLDFKHLKVLVYDDIDLMDEEQLALADDGLNKLIRTDEAYPQVVIVSQKYDAAQLAKLRTLNCNSALIFGDLLEAAMYGEMRFQLSLRTTQEKLNDVLKLLQQRPPKDYRTVVFCSDDADMRHLVGHLEAEYSCLPYYQDANLDVAEQLHRWKADTRGIILLATDYLPELNIRHAHTLIHYSMSSSWGKFKMRHLAISSNLINKLDTSGLSRQENALPLHSLVLLDGTNQRQLPRLVDFVKRFQPVDDAVVAVAMQIRKLLASQSPNRNVLCRYLMMLGNCIKAGCEERHNADEIDRPSALVPASGDVKVRLVRVYSPAHFCVHILEHLPPGQSWKKFPSVPAEQMRRQLLQGSGNERYWPPVVGAVCLYRTDDNKVRVRVLKVAPIKNVNLSVSNLGVVVQAMDEDTRVLSVRSGRLYKCPEELQAKPPLAIDLRLFGMIPQTGDRDWSEKDRCAIESSLKALPDNCFLQATVAFATAHTIFINNLIAISYASTMQVHVRRLSLCRHLTENGMAKSCQKAKNKILAFFGDVTTAVVEPAVSGLLEDNPRGEQQMQVEELPKEETKENESPNTSGFSCGLFLDVIQLGLEDDESTGEARAQPKLPKQQRKQAARNASLKSLMECITSMSQLQMGEDDFGMPEEDFRHMLDGASKFLEYMENGPQPSEDVRGQRKNSRKRKEAKYPVDFEITLPPPQMPLEPPPNVVRPPTTYYQTLDTLELHVLLPDQSFEYTAVLIDNHVLFHASHPSTELRHQFSLPLGVAYSYLKHYMRGRTVYVSVKKTVAIDDPLDFGHYHNFLSANHDQFRPMEEVKDLEEHVRKFGTPEERMDLLAEKYEQEEKGVDVDESGSMEEVGVERMVKYEPYED